MQEFVIKKGWTWNNWRLSWCWRRTMRVPSSAKRLSVGSGRNHSRVFIGIAEILQRKLRYISGSNVTRIQDLLENNLMLGKVENKRKRGRQKTGWNDGVVEATYKNIEDIREIVQDRRARRDMVHGSWFKSRLRPSD